MTEFARGGIVTGPDPTPIFTETLLALPCGYVLSARQLAAMGHTDGWLAKLNEALTAR